MEKFALANKYKGLESNVWVEFIQLGLEYKPLNLGQGLPDDLVPHSVLEELKNISADPNPNSVLHQYTRGFGHPRLIQALSKLYGRLLNHPVDPLKEVLVTDGAYEALFTSIMGHINPGDEVIIIEPYFDCYEPKVKLAGGTPVFISLAPTKKDGHITSADWKLNPEELSAAFTPKTKAIIFNNPNNPLGKVYKRDEIQMIADLCIKHNVLCISDDVYEHMVFDDNEMIRMATLPGMWERTITIGSAGKTFSVTGWKLGWALGPEHLIRNCQIVHQNCVYTCPTPIQEAVARSLEKEMERIDSPECYFKSISKDLQTKRDYIARVLKDIGMNPVIPEGGYFILADWSSFADKVDLSSETDKRQDYKFVKWLIKNRKLQGIPPSAFFSEDHKHIGESYIRLCFIKHNDSLQKAEEILKAWKKELD
ncbi:kynurenine aminotransferase isoform X2 [Lepeophtheirus salmonis]|nr:kynurenine--oxoglutarate transaminase 3-like isoform X2 [Lepeophtheirus salmonis]XP_040574002.1 kynurenine--oxoglutarate transaminase 3-like isoform X2 [Lepeophtheirus salmonis]